MSTTPVPNPTPRRRSLLSALLGRPASSFTVEQLDALPHGTAFGAQGLSPDDCLAFTLTPRGWVDMFGGVTSERLRAMPGLVCIGVGEIEIEGAERSDGITALTSLDALLPRPTKPLHVIAEEAQRRPRMSVADAEEVLELTYRLRTIAMRADCDLSIVVAPDTAQVQVLRAVPDLIGATKAANSDHLHHVDAAGTLMMWRQ